MGNIILVIWRWWLKTSWAIGINLNQSFRVNRGSHLFRLSVISKRMSIFIWVVNVSQIIIIDSVLEHDWLLHLVRNVVLVIWRWWLEASWVGWVNLGESLILLSVVTNVVEILKCIVMMLEVIIINLVLPVKRVLHLMRHIVLVIWWWWLKTRWGLWANLGQLLLLLVTSLHLSVLSKSVVVFSWVVDVSEIIGINSILEDQRLLHLMGNIILMIWWWWLETCWISWVNLGIVTNMIEVFKSIVMMLQVIIIDLVLPVQRMLHLMRNIILIIRRWWLQASCFLRADLN